jgi:hypothetical protein
MAIKLIALALTFIFSQKSQSQVILNNDTSYTPYSDKLIKQIDSTFHLIQQYDFEFRFWIQHAKSVKRQLFILALKDKHWSARLFERTYKGSDTLIELPVKQDGLENLWRKLESNNLLTIKDDSELRDKKGDAPFLKIFDGASFRFELLTASSKRSYVYHCPKGYSKEFRYIKEYKWIVRMIKLIYKYCDINPNYIC